MTGPQRARLRRFDPRHGFYQVATGVNLFIRRRLRPMGVGLLLLIVITSFVAAGGADVPIFRAFAFSVALAGLGMVGMPFRRVKLEVRRELPRHATVGHPVTIHLHVKNAGHGTYRNFALVESPPDSRPRKELFLRAREPGEEERNFFDRWLAWYRWDWLCRTRQPFEAKATPFVDRLAPGNSVFLTLEVVPSRRGLMPLKDLRALLPEPLGLFQRYKKLNAPADALPVLPRRYRLPPFELPGSARYQAGGDAVSRNMGPSGEFVALREYRAGDPPRLIHWPTWARTGQPAVKELEDCFFPRHGLVLDTFPEAGDEDLFEDAVAVAASFVSAADTRESLIDLMFIAGQERVITAGGGVGRRETLLEVLAGVEAAEDEDFGSLSRLVQRHSEDLAGCLCVFTGWSESRRNFLDRLMRTGIETAALVICRDAPPAAMKRVHFLRRHDLARDLLHLPRNL